jgi:excisionase family DNA binding protein
MLTDYVSLECLALQLALPKTYLKRLADSGKLPYIDTGNGRKRFQEQSVREALSQIEQQSLTTTKGVICAH